MTAWVTSWTGVSLDRNPGEAKGLLPQPSPRLPGEMHVHSLTAASTSFWLLGATPTVNLPYAWGGPGALTSAMMAGSFPQVTTQETTGVSPPSAK